MSIGLSFVGLAIGFLLLIILTYKGMHISWVSIIVGLLLLVTSRLPIAKTWTDTIGAGIGQIASTLIPVFIVGATFGKLVSVTGAADSFAKTILRVLTARLSPSGKRIAGGFLIILMGILMSYAGIDNFAILFTQIAIATSIMKEVNIPRRFLAALIIVGSTVGGNLPGTPSFINIMAVQFLVDTTPMAAPALAITGALVILVFSLWGMSRMWEKDIAKGINFDCGTLTMACFDDSKLPPWYFLLIPTAVIFVLYNVFHWTPFFAVLGGVVIAAILLYSYMPYEKDGKKSIALSKLVKLNEQFSGGAELAGIPAIMIINMALGNLIAATPAFGFMVQKLGGLSQVINPYLLFSILSIFIVGISASPSGLIIMFNLAHTLFIPAMGVNPMAAHRIIAFSATVFDTLPFGNMVCALLLLTGVKHKEGYPPILYATVGITFVAAMVVTVMAILIY
jgi:H+/gluconate symporter-like permease